MTETRDKQTGSSIKSRNITKRIKNSQVVDKIKIQQPSSLKFYDKPNSQNSPKYKRIKEQLLEGAHIDMLKPLHQNSQLNERPAQMD